jgi:PIN domain nuclease of toxin-antitoxin system
VNGFLLDTSAFLILGLEDRQVSAAVRETLATAPRFVSQLCATEIAIKRSVGKLLLPEPFQIAFAIAFERMVSEFEADLLALEMGHVDVFSRLPLRHRDPFDRLIIAQAIAEDLIVVTRDRVFASYDIDVLEI